MIKAVAFDNCCVITKYDSLDFVSKEIGKEDEGKYWDARYYEALSSAKNDSERESSTVDCLKGKYSITEGVSVDKLKEICSRIELTEGSKECIESIRRSGLKLVVISATLLPIARFTAESNGLGIDDIIASECKMNGKIGEATYIMTPLEKGRKLKKFLDKNDIKPEECVAVGDSTSELFMFRLVGKERSIGFNCRDSLKAHVGHIASHFGDEKRNLMSVLEIIKTL